MNGYNLILTPKSGTRPPIRDLVINETKLECSGILDKDALSNGNVYLLFWMGIFLFSPQNGAKPLFETHSDKDLNIMGPVLCTCICLY